MARGTLPSRPSFSSFRASLSSWFVSYAISSTVSPLWATDSIE